MGPYPLNSIITGDARILAEEIPDESVDLIFTDPVYDNIDDYQWLSEIATRMLKQRGHLIAFFQTNLARPTANAIYDGGMEPAWILSIYLHGGPSRRIAIGHTKHRLAWLCIKHEQPMWQHNLVDVITSVNVCNEDRYYDWQKDGKAITKWINWLTEKNNIILDPFAGSGTILSSCKILGRNYLAFEINSEIAELARQRVMNTQPPLFVPEPQQLELSV